MTPTSVATPPTLISIAHVTSKPLTWLWPGRIPLGQLTLLDATPGSGLSLFTLTLAARISSGTPLPDGTCPQQSTVLLIAPYDTPDDTILPRFQAAGGDLTRLVLYRSHSQETPQTTVRSRTLELPRDLDHLATTICQLDARLVIIDPATSITGLNRCLPALLDLAHHTNCAIVLTRSLSRAPADPLNPRCPASPVLTAARSHLLLAPDPADERHCLLLTPKHSLCASPSILAYTITPTDQDIPTLHWLPAPDPTHLRRLCTGPIRSPHRQAILHFLRECPNPCHIKDILAATSYDYEAGRKMLVRMKMAGELVSLDRGLYTTARHPCLAHITNNSQPDSSASLVPVSNVPDPVNELFTLAEQNHGTSVGADVSRPAPIDRPPTNPNDSQTDLFNRMIATGEEALARVKARLAASGYPVPTIPLSHVPSLNSNNSHDSLAAESSNSAGPGNDKGIMVQSFTPWGLDCPSPKE